MRLLLSILACTCLIFTACSTPALLTGKGKNEVIFVREYHDYGKRYYNADSVKMPKPMPILMDVYLVAYQLSPRSLTIYKRAYGHSEVQTVLFTKVLSKTDSRFTAQCLAAIRPVQVAQQCQSRSQDDGFHLNVTLTKAGNSTSFDWSGYEADLVGLIAVVNKLAPDKYKFYDPNRYEEFKQQLLHATNAP